MPMPSRDVGTWVGFGCGAVVCLRPHEKALITAAGGGPVASWGMEGNGFQILTIHTFVKENGGPFEHLHFWEQHPKNTPGEAKIERPVPTAMPSNNPIANFRLMFNPTLIRLAYHTSHLVELLRDGGNPEVAAKMRLIAENLTDNDVARALGVFDGGYMSGNWLEAADNVPPVWIQLHQDVVDGRLSLVA